MKNNFDLKGYMKSNQVGSYQQLNEMWYQDINQALGDFNVIKEEEEIKEAESNDKELTALVGKSQFKLDHIDGNVIAFVSSKYGDEENETPGMQDIQTAKALKKEIESKYDYEVDLEAQGEQVYLIVTRKSKSDSIANEDDNLEEMGGVKTIGDAGKMVTPNSRPNLARHRSSDMLDKMSKKDHKTNTVVGAKAAAYKAPHMKEEETADDIFAGSDAANWNGKAERMDWEKDLVGKEVGNWKSDIEQQAGSISWTSEKYPNAIIYATPGWEGVDGIAVEVHESEEGFLDEPKLQKVVAAGTDLWKTKEGYLALMAKIFTTLEKMLTPAEMTEDHGTQINHDFNDDISMDYTEPEHMVQNEDEDPFGSIKGGIDKITMGDDDMDMGDDDRMMSLGGDRIKAGIESLMADGFDYREILQFVKDTIAAKRNF